MAAVASTNTDSSKQTTGYALYRKDLKANQKITYETGMWAALGKEGQARWNQLAGRVPKVKPATDAKGRADLYHTYQNMASKKVGKIPNDPATGKPYLWKKITEGTTAGDQAMKDLYEMVKAEFAAKTQL